MNEGVDTSDAALYRKFASGYSVRGIAQEFGRGYEEIEMRLRAIMVGMQIAAEGLRSEQEADG
jgi:hypothetical protein